MVRYTAEQKNEALTMMAEQGATKTSAALGIAQPTLFAWRRAAAEKDGQAPVSGQKKRNAKPKTVKKDKAAPKQEAEMDETVLPPQDTEAENAIPQPQTASMDEIHAMLTEDEKLIQKLQELETEVIHLRQQNSKLKKMILRLIEE